MKVIIKRGGMRNTGYKITHDKALTVGFMGGSVTGGMGCTPGTKGYRGRLFNAIQGAYDVELTEASSTLGGNGSQYGVYITDRFIASQNPDVVFIEYAVNNAYDGVHEADELWNHYETMIHKIRTANPYADIVLLYISDRRDVSGPLIPILEQVADRYELTSVHLYQAITDSLAEHGYEWDEYYLNAKGVVDGVHPNDNGYDVIASVLLDVVRDAVSDAPLTYEKWETPSPKGAVQDKATAFFPSSLETVPNGWEKVSKFSYAGQLYGGCIQTTTTNPITVKFSGTHLVALVEYSPDAGVLEYAVDGGETQMFNCRMSYSNPKAKPLAKNLPNGEHVVTLNLQDNDQQYRMALGALLVNGEVVSVK